MVEAPNEKSVVPSCSILMVPERCSLTHSPTNHHLVQKGPKCLLLHTHTHTRQHYDVVQYLKSTPPPEKKKRETYQYDCQNG